MGGSLATALICFAAGAVTTWGALSLAMRLPRTQMPLRRTLMSVALVSGFVSAALWALALAFLNPSMPAYLLVVMGLWILAACSGGVWAFWRASRRADVAARQRAATSAATATSQPAPFDLSGASWTLATTVTTEDAAKASGQAAESQTPTTADKVLKGLWVAQLVFFALVWVAVVSMLAVYKGWPDAAIGGLIGGALLGFVGYRGNPARYRGALMESMVRNVAPKRSGRAVWVVNQTGIQTSWEPNSDRPLMVWRDVTGVTASPDYVLFRTAAKTVPFIPRRAFESADDVARFVAFAEKMIAAASAASVEQALQPGAPNVGIES